jgi:hypothetical protein
LEITDKLFLSQTQQMSFINSRRLRDYPRLMLGTMFFVLLLNILLRQGWMGALGQIIGGDFLAQYSGGLLYRQHPEQLYDFVSQYTTQQSIVEPTSLWGVNIYTYPPYVALIHSLSTYLPYLPSLLFRTLLTISYTLLASYIIYQYLIPQYVKGSSLTTRHIVVLTFSFMPFVVGLQMGQNHGLTLFLITGILAAVFYEKWLTAGILCGFLLYKPQFALGFLVIFLMWRQFKPIAAAALIALCWNSIVWLQNGVDIFLRYLQVTPQFLQLPYLKGAGGEMQVTPYGLLVSLLPQQYWTTVLNAYKLWLLGLLILLAFVAYQFRNKPIQERIPILILATLFGLVAAPHSLVHEMIILIPVFALCAWVSKSRTLLYLIIAVYLGVLFLIPLSYQWGIALLAFIPIGSFLAVLIFIIRRHSLLKEPDCLGQETIK